MTFYTTTGALRLYSRRIVRARNRNPNCCARYGPSGVGLALCCDYRTPLLAYAADSSYT